jgi:hypothetical protein
LPFLLWIHVYSSGQLFGFVFIQKDRFMLWIGIASICFSIYTIRFTIPYYLLKLPNHWWFGIICFYFFCHKRLKTIPLELLFSQIVFTRKSIWHCRNTFGVTIGIKPETTVESPMEFGDGVLVAEVLVVVLR